jgi:hypothetical protein
VVKLTTKNSDGVGIKKMEKIILEVEYKTAGNIYKLGNNKQFKTLLYLYKNGEYFGLVCISDLFELVKEQNNKQKEIIKKIRGLN